jgi:hypothetical protein
MIPASSQAPALGLPKQEARPALRGSVTARSRPDHLRCPGYRGAGCWTAHGMPLFVCEYTHRPIFFFGFWSLTPVYVQTSLILDIQTQWRTNTQRLNLHPVAQRNCQDAHGSVLPLCTNERQT